MSAEHDCLERFEVELMAAFEREGLNFDAFWATFRAGALAARPQNRRSLRVTADTVVSELGGGENVDRILTAAFDAARRPRMDFDWPEGQL